MEEMEEVKKFTYLGIMVNVEGRLGYEVNNWREGRYGEFSIGCGRRAEIARKVKRELYESVLIPTNI